MNHPCCSDLGLELVLTYMSQTIFERSFARTEGLARLLVLEKLPKNTDRDTYQHKRREERGRPPVSIYLRRRQGRELKGNIKDDWEDEVPEWQEEDQVSNYHTFVRTARSASLLYRLTKL